MEVVAGPSKKVCVCVCVPLGGGQQGSGGWWRRGQQEGDKSREVYSRGRWWQGPARRGGGGMGQKKLGVGGGMEVVAGWGT
jgi:hypothetical protein